MKIELLSPAKDKICGFAAIDYGADAVYIGAPKFGARKNASNSIEDINELISYAHKFNVKVYPTVNTILYNEELEEAEKLIHNLYEVGADAIIIQDLGILEMNLPPIRLFASTQMHNYSLERIKFFEKIGIKRIILARELSLEQIKNIRNNTSSVELEFFIHGALCVSFSGQCYFSEAILNRSANRGECAQPCRMKYDLADKNGNIILKNKFLLSLKDLKLSDYLEKLIEFGITSFKIEGRLKDSSYVKNITSYYRSLLDEIIKKNNNLEKSSSGYTKINFTPSPEKSFNRSFTSYFIKGQRNHIASLHFEKSIGEQLGKINEIGKNYITVNTTKNINNGDGICFFINNILYGTNVNKVENNKLYLNEMYHFKKDTIVYRNYDIKFEKFLQNNKIKRKVPLDFIIESKDSNLIITGIDEDKNVITNKLKIDPDSNYQKDLKEILKSQLQKTGNSIFEVNSIILKGDFNFYMPISKINEIRRNIVTELENLRLLTYKREESTIVKNDLPYPIKDLDYSYNVTNYKAKEFYLRHKVNNISEGFELLKDRKDKIIMTTRYCIRYETGLCPIIDKKNKPEPLFLINNKNKFKIEFDCKNCIMKIYYS